MIDGKCPNVSHHSTKKGISFPTDMCFGDVKEIPKKGHQSQALFIDDSESAINPFSLGILSSLQQSNIALHKIVHLVGGLVAIFYFPRNIGFMSSSQLKNSIIFQVGVALAHQPAIDELAPVLWRYLLGAMDTHSFSLAFWCGSWRGSGAELGGEHPTFIVLVG